MNAELLPKLRIHDMHRATDYVPGKLVDKNAKALSDYYDRANKNGVLTNTHEFTKRFLDGITAKQWMLGK